MKPNQSPPWNRLDWLALLAFAMLVALFYWPILTPNPADRQSFPPGDFHAQFWAFTTFEVRELSAGRLPLWNPYTFAGAPFWADVQSAVFYPPSLLTLLLSAPWGFSLFGLELEAIAHFWLAGTFMYLFARRLTGQRGAPFIAALVWAFGGYLTGYPSQQLAVLQADVWLPLILFFLHRAAPSTQTLNPNLLLAGVAWGLTVLAGHPQSAFIIGTISGLYLLFLQIQSTTESHNGLDKNPQFAIRNSQFAIRFTFYVLRFTKPLLTFWLTGLALAAIQFIPAVEYTLRSVRAAGTYNAMSGGFPIIDLIQLLLPGQVSHYSPLYVGVVGLTLALWVIFSAPTREIVFWAITGAVALLISLGGNSFLYSLLYLSTPGFAIFRGQERWAIVVAFSLAVLAGYGYKQLTMSNYQLSKKSTIHNPQSAIRNSRTLLQITKYLFFLSLLLLFLFFFGLNDTGWTPDNPFYGLLSAATLLTIMTALAWLLWRFAPSLPPMLTLIFTAALICLDLFSVNWQTNLYPQPPEWHTQTPAVVQALKADAAQSPAEPFRVYNEFRLFDNYGVPYQIEDLWGASPLRPARYDEFLAPPMPIERTWALLNVKYVITWREELYVPSTIIYQEPAADGTTYLHRLDDVGPRAWLVPAAQVADDETILQTIADPAFNPGQLALLEASSELTNLEIDESTPPPNSQFSILNAQFPSPSQLSYQIRADAPALLVLSQPYYPGWQATVDGQAAPVFRADYVLQAVPVPAGQHTVTLTFQPLSFTIGAMISGLAIIAVAAGLIIDYRRGRR